MPQREFAHLLSRCCIPNESRKRDHELDQVSQPPRFEQAKRDEDGEEYSFRRLAIREDRKQSEH